MCYKSLLHCVGLKGYVYTPSGAAAFAAMDDEGLYEAHNNRDVINQTKNAARKAKRRTLGEHALQRHAELFSNELRDDSSGTKYKQTVAAR